jgi:hypothetical protein
MPSRPVKGTERWAARMQRSADARDERYRRRQAAVGTGEIPPSLADGLIDHQQAAFDRSEATRRARSDAFLARYPEIGSYSEASDQLHSGPVCGPDGVEVSVWITKSGRVRAARPAPPTWWPRSRVKRFLATTGYRLSLPRKLLASQETYTAYAYTLSGPLVRVARRFLNWEEAFLYAASLAKRVRADGVEALRPDALPAAPGGTDAGPRT